MYTRDGVRLSGRGARVLECRLQRDLGSHVFFREGVEVNECPAGFFQIYGKGKISRDMSNGNVKKRNSGLKVYYTSCRSIVNKQTSLEG